MAALNTAMFEDGALVEIADGAVIEQPIELRFLTSGERPVMTFPRNLILAGRDSQAQIVEVYEGSDGAGYFTNAVTEIDAAPTGRWWRIIKSSGNWKRVCTSGCWQ